MVYRIKLVSQTNALVLILFILILFLGGVFIFIPHGLHDKGLAYFLMFIVATIFYVSWQRFVTGRTEWTVDNNNIAIVWTKGFVLAKSKDLNLKWSEIENISKGLDPHYYNLKIKFSTGKTIKFYHDTLTTRDDFEALLKTLYQTLNDKKATANIGIAATARTPTH